MRLGSQKKKKARRLGKLVFISFLLFGIVFGIWKLDVFSQCVNQLNSCVNSISSCASSFSSCADNALKKIIGLFNNQDNLKLKNIFEPEKKTDEETPRLTRQELKDLINTHLVVNSEKRNFTLNINNQILAVDTSLDIRLQHFVLSRLQKLKGLDRGKPEIIAIVTMEPETGRILTMAGFDLSSPDTNPCTQGEYPAASLFKIVTASAAVETCGYSPRTPLYFNGRKYTLYKRQLKEIKNCNTNKVSFETAFAQSINPVFGKLGAKKLGGSVLKEYARAFGFNQPIDSDLTIRAPVTEITDIPYQWAEIASGFNKTTLISPVFGAMLTSTILNSGKTPVPCLVESVTDEKGNLIYNRKNETAHYAVKPGTAKTVMKLMNKTVTLGTARKYFRGSKKDAVLSKLDIGGKTGSLYNRAHTVKFDWFTGFAREKRGKKQIVISVVVGHGKYIGTRASALGKMILKEYFNNCLASNSQKINNG